MTRKQMGCGILANVIFWGFIGLVIVTDGWAAIAAAIAFVVFGLFSMGSWVAGR